MKLLQILILIVFLIFINSNEYVYASTYSIEAVDKYTSALGADYYDYVVKVYFPTDVAPGNGAYYDFNIKLINIVGVTGNNIESSDCAMKQPSDFPTTQGYTTCWLRGVPKDEEWGTFLLKENGTTISTGQLNLSEASDKTGGIPPPAGGTPPLEGTPPLGGGGSEGSITGTCPSDISQWSGDNFTIECFSVLGNKLLNIFIAIGILATIFMLPYAGILLASGSEQNVQKAKEIITALIYGLLLLILSGAIVLIIGEEVFGF